MGNIISGAMYGSQMLPKEEFISTVSNMIMTDKDSVIQHLLAIQASVGVSPRAAYLEWEKFQVNILKNPKTQLLSILNFWNQNNSQSWVVANEEYAIDPTGLINVERLGGEIRKEYHSDILTKHLSKMFSTIRNQEISSSALSYLMQKYNFTPKMAEGKKRTYANVFWSKEEQGFKMRGQVAEAFLTHVAKTHLSAISSKTKLATDFSNNSILKSEGIYGFVDLLYASKNRDAWFTGGDLIVTDKNGEVIANIQLKTSFGSGSAIGRIKTASLQKEINILLQKVNSPLKMAEHFYNMLATSAVMVELDKKIESSGYNFVEEIMQLT